MLGQHPIMKTKENPAIRYITTTRGYFSLFDEESNTTRNATFKIKLATDNYNIIEIQFANKTAPDIGWVRFDNSNDSSIKENFQKYLKRKYVNQSKE